MIDAPSVGRRLARYACDAAAFLLPLASYVVAAVPEPGTWDTAEFQGVPYILGVTHQTGFPLFVLLGWAWSHALPFGTIAYRMDAFSAVVTSGVAALAYASARLVGAWRPVALAAALWFAWSANVFWHGSHAEAMPLAVLFQAAATYALLRWTAGEPNRWFAAACAFEGLALAVHPLALWTLPALAAAVFFQRRRMSFALAGGSCVLLAAPLLFYAYVILRSAYVVAHGLDPTAGLAGTDGGLFWNYHNPSTPARFAAYVTGGEYAAPHYIFASLNPLRWLEAAWEYVKVVTTQYGVLGIAAAVAAAVAAVRLDWRRTLVLALATLTPMIFVVTYTPESDTGRYELFASWLVVPLLGALSAALQRAADRRYVHALLAVAVVGALASLYSARDAHARFVSGAPVIASVAPLVPPGSVILSDWKDATPLAYGAYAGGSFAGRTVVSGKVERLAPFYRRWTNGGRRRVFVLTDPSLVLEVPHAKLVRFIDDWHYLYEVRP